MFNDIEKKLKLSSIINLVVGVLFSWFSAKYIIIVTERDPAGVRTDWIQGGPINTVAYTVMGIAIAVSVLSMWIAFAIQKDKRAPFKWLSSAGKALRIIAWIVLIGGLAGVFMFCFWCFFNVESDNALVNAISYTFIALIPLAVMVFCFAFFIYGLGNAADGGDATYVVESKLHAMEPLHDDRDNRKICPNCGTRTDKHSCPNCGVRID